MSEANLRGKTSILNVIRWSLTGKRSVRDDMLGWFERIRIEFVLDGRTFRVDVINAHEAEGRILRIVDDRELVISDFWDDPSFEAAMGDFFMQELGLQPIINHADRDGKSVEVPHGWNWLFTSMLIEPNPAATFGSQGIAGMPTRMMQMFMGLPWANTTNDIMAAQGRLATKTAQADALTAGIQKRTQDRIAELKRQREAAASKPRVDTSDIRIKLRQASDGFSRLEAKLRALQQSLKIVEDDAGAAILAHDESRRSLQALKEGVAAGYVFRTLRPICCPSCDETFSPERERERQGEHLCMVCGTPDVEAEDSTDALQKAEAAVKVANAERSRQQKRLSELRSQIEKTEKDRTTSEQEFSALEKAFADAKPEDDPRLTIMLIEAQLKELEVLAASSAAGDDTAEEAKILKVAETVTKSIYHDEQGRVLNLVSDVALDYAQRFGIESLSELQINGAGQMRLVKRGTPTSFRHQTDGEKARLKVAATLAMLKVSEREGVGRHTGLLLIDSPKSNEMIDKDYAMLMQGLSSLTEELKSIQIIFTGIAQPIVLGLVPEKNRLHARGESYLW
ncbi:hypothetical protein JUM41_01660 [Rhizobium pusense]|uniref:ATP-binding protein n=1 Tax=Agrobacterium pusense TaxID=648995 RepID=UPI001FCC1514|nr:ATP-binding protein [Agrobacterium pusense]MCJ2872933.1 hypothetical protein [Agrobacterium pusense]